MFFFLPNLLLTQKIWSVLCWCHSEHRLPYSFGCRMYIPLSFQNPLTVKGSCGNHSICQYLWIPDYTHPLSSSSSSSAIAVSLKMPEWQTNERRLVMHWWFVLLSPLHACTSILPLMCTIDIFNNVFLQALWRTPARGGGRGGMKSRRCSVLVSHSIRSDIKSPVASCVLDTWRSSGSSPHC